jgi:hypothetical protein
MEGGASSEGEVWIVGIDDKGNWCGVGESGDGERAGGGGGVGVEGDGVGEMGFKRRFKRGKGVCGVEVRVLILVRVWI